jgi:predicted membrane-bound spermidine synthase
MPELLKDILGLVIFFSPCITAFALAAFSPLKQLRQPVRLFVIGFVNGVIAALISGLGMLRGVISSRALLFIVGMSIVIGAFFSLLASSETITEKKRDELVRKSDDQSWRG